MNAISNRSDMLAGTCLREPVHPDADLIRICAEHLVNRDAFNNSPRDIEYEDDPLWVAYEHTRREIDRAKPTTLEGLRAKARCAKAEAMMPKGREISDGGPPQAWAWDLVNDLLAEFSDRRERPTSQDVQLLALCDEFDKLEDAYTATFTKGNPAYIKNDEKRRKVYWPLVERQQEIGPIIATMPAHTAIGVLAKLRTFAKWDLEILKPDGAERNVAETILSSACRDVMQGFGA